ncbi:hypothetical protein [Nostoc sphaeroides]|nr:hypothetical protein [Nostoc sphaeroides]
MSVKITLGELLSQLIHFGLSLTPQILHLTLAMQFLSVVYIGGIAASVLSGAIASATGYTFMFIISAALSLLSVLLITNLRA